MWGYLVCTVWRLWALRLLIACVQLLCYALQYSIDRIYVNVSASVMITSALHLVGNDQEKEKNPITVT